MPTTPTFAGFEDLVEQARVVFPETFALSSPSAGELLDQYIDSLVQQNPNGSFAANRARHRPIWFWAGHWASMLFPVVDVSRDIGARMIAASAPSPSFAQQISLLSAYLVRFGVESPYVTGAGTRVDHLIVSHESKSIFVATHAAGAGVGWTARCDGTSFDDDAPAADKPAMQALWRVVAGVETALTEMTHLEQPTGDRGFDPMQTTGPSVYVITA